MYLDAGRHLDALAYELGANLFGRQCGSADLAESRKAQAADVWAARHTARRG